MMNLMLKNVLIFLLVLLSVLLKLVDTFNPGKIIEILATKLKSSCVCRLNEYMKLYVKTLTEIS